MFSVVNFFVSSLITIVLRVIQQLPKRSHSYHCLLVFKKVPEIFALVFILINSAWASYKDGSANNLVSYH